MKKSVYFLFAITMAIMSVSLAACGDDDEPAYSTQDRGSITVKYKGYNTERYLVYSASFHYYVSQNKTHFQAELKERYDDIIPSNTFGFDIDGSLGSSTTLKIKEIYLTSGGAWNTYSQKGGQVTVKSVKGDNVTLEFTDVKYGNAVLNGEITYKKEAY